MKTERLHELLLIVAEVLVEFRDEFLHRTEVREVRRFGRHVRTVYNDGRETMHTLKRFPGEQTGVSFYEMMQLGMELPDLHPKEPMSPWMATAMGIGAAMVLPWMTSFLKGGK